jgi:hypothetical protein
MFKDQTEIQNCQNKLRLFEEAQICFSIFEETFSLLYVAVA